MRDEMKDNMRDKIKRNSFGRAIKADNQSEKI
jgi:hypothetical protein